MAIEQKVSGTMKKLTRKLGFSVSTLLPVLLLSTYGTAVQAQDAEPDIYSCKQCVKYTGWYGALLFGFVERMYEPVLALPLAVS